MSRYILGFCLNYIKYNIIYNIRYSNIFTRFQKNTISYI